MELKNFETRYLIMFYLFPIICKNKSDFELLYHPRMKGVYIGDTNKPEWENKLVVLFKTCAPKKFKDFFNNNEYSYKSYYENIDNDFYEILSFQIPPKYKNDLAIVLNNKFTEVSAPFKEHVDWISYPINSKDYWNNYNKLHLKLWSIKETEIQLNLNGV